MRDLETFIVLIMAIEKLQPEQWLNYSEAITLFEKPDKAKVPPP